MNVKAATSSQLPPQVRKTLPHLTFEEIRHELAIQNWSLLGTKKFPILSKCKSERLGGCQE